MKTSKSFPTSVPVGQTAAILGAIQTGFFEAYLEKSEVSPLLRQRNCFSVRLTVQNCEAGPGRFQAEIIRRNGQESLLSDRELLCSHHFATFSKPYSVEFSPGDLGQLLSHPDCSGLRFFPGTISGEVLTLVAVGVRSNGFDIAEGAGYLCSQTVTRN